MSVVADRLKCSALLTSSFSQLKKDYGKDYAEVIMNITGNIISGQVSGETAKQLSERFGKILQGRTSLSINRTDTSVSKSQHLDAAIPPSTISSLSSGEFVGFVADNPEEKIDLKGFHSRFTRAENASTGKNHQAELPIIRKVDSSIVQHNYRQIKLDVEGIAESEINRIAEDPDLRRLIINKAKC